MKLPTDEQVREAYATDPEADYRNPIEAPRWYQENKRIFDQWLAAHDAKVQVTSGTSDGHHTFEELYEYRMLYNAHAAQGWLAAGIPVVKSWHHSDGELAFGGGWFIVVAELPTGQVANHYKTEHWDLFDVPAVDLPPEYDGHTPAVAAERLLAAIRAAPASRERQLMYEIPKPEVVCLCGSTRFYDEFQEANYDLTMSGKIVLSVGFYPHSKAKHGHGEGVGHNSAEKVALDNLHKRKIDLADWVYVLNVGGYIGDSTRSEIAYALDHGKHVVYLEPTDSETGEH